MSNESLASLHVRIESNEGTTREADVDLAAGVIAGWTGRDRAALEKHIEELEALGVKRPATTPIFYRVSANRFTDADLIEVPGGASSGEAEYLLLAHGDDLFVGLGSDHTDREAEAFNVTVSKQMCDKPVAPTLWRLDDVLDHWDDLVLRSHMVVEGERRLYQEGSVNGMLDPKELIARFEALGGHFANGTAMLCGTLPAIGGLAYGEQFDMELEDPVLGRSIRHSYRIRNLPNEG